MSPVERTDPDGVDFGWVMQTTFVVTIVVGAPLVAVSSLTADLSTWPEMARYAIGVAAPVWFGTAVVVSLYARYRTG